MNWTLSNRADPKAREIADRHYNRQKPGTAQFVPPGRCLVLWQPGALWVTSWPFAEYVGHEWPGSWVCSAFRREETCEGPQASDLIREAVAATRWRYGDNPLGMVTFVDEKQVKAKRNPGYCFIAAGFKVVGHTKGGLLALLMEPSDMPEAEPPDGAQMPLVLAGVSSNGDTP